MKQLRRILCAVLAILLCLGMMTGCGSAGDTVMSLGRQRITMNMYIYWLSRYKAVHLYEYGGNTDSAEFWDMVVDENGHTRNEIFTAYILDNTMTRLAALYLFDEYKLHLPESSARAIDAAIDGLIEEAGSERALNEQLSAYAINADMLREIFTLEEKVAYLQDYLIAENGPSPLTEAYKNAYCREQYVRFKHIFISTSDEYVVDETGAYVTDANGNPKTLPLSAAALAEKKKKADELEAKLTGGEAFETLMPLYNEDTTTAATYPNGLYITPYTNYVTEVKDAIFGMEAGEWRMVESNLGYHFFMRLDVEDGAYADPQNADFFSTFESDVSTEWFFEVMKPYKDQITINSERVNAYSLKTVNPNYYY